MEQEMKVSPVAVRRLRAARNWSQEHLADVAGLSLRTVQRVEAEGTASASTRMSLAAAFGIEWGELLGKVQADQPQHMKPSFSPGVLYAGLAVVTVALCSESGRQPGMPVSAVMAALNALLATIGVWLILPALRSLIAGRYVAGIVLAGLATPLLFLSVIGALAAAFGGWAPFWQLGVPGACGLVLLVMASRTFGVWRGPITVGGRVGDPS